MDFQQERRKSRRIKGAVVEYRRADDNNSSKKTTFIKDISIDGICIIVPEMVDTDAVFLLDIYLPGISSSIKAKGKFAWQKESAYFSTNGSRHYDLGMKLLDMSEGDKARMAQLLSIDETAPDGGS
ncbi:MAG: PilZ domain-containing protein [Candidatus Omnitrophota bacterium]